MARARNIKPGFYKNEELAECSVWARLLFPGLWTLADREGRLEDRPKRIKGELLPFDSQDVEPLLRELTHKKFLERYEVDGERFIQITKFLKHQSPHYSEKKSVIKPPPLPEKAPDIHPPNSGSSPVIKEGSQPPDSLIPDSLIPDSLIPDSLIPEKKPDLRSVKEKRATRFPTDFSITDSHRKVAKELGLNLQYEFDKFRDDALSKGKKFEVWSLAFGNWLRRANEFNGSGKPQKQIDYDELIATAKAREEANAH